MFTYSQQTGIFIDETGKGYGVCYSGHGEGKNNPLLQNVHDVGPIPRGIYRISTPITSVKMGPLAFKLTPVDKPLLNGRDGFFIHGDNPTHDASTGCIIMGREGRSSLEGKVAGFELLEVY